MSNQINTDWIGFYDAFAKVLLTYRDDRKSLINKIKSVFSNIGIPLPKLEHDNNITDIDPFTVFGLFNKGIVEWKRKKIIKGLAEEFSVTEKQPESFDSIPVVFIMQSAFYRFAGERGEDDIENLWKVFESALYFADDNTEENRKTFISAYDTVLKQNGIKWNLSMGLYWIRPHKFVNLDSRNREILSSTEYMPDEFVAKTKGFKNIPTAEEYIDLCDSVFEYIDKKKIPFESIPALSYKAWLVTKENEGKYAFEGYWPTLKEYNPKMTVDKWVSVLNDSQITGVENLKMFKMMLEQGGESTCANLAEKYGNTAQHYNALGSSFGRKVFNKFKLPECIDNGDARYFTIPFVGRPVVENGKDRYLWKLRPELKEALETMDMSTVKTKKQSKETEAHPDKNIILYGPPGTGKTYNTVIYAVAIIENKMISEVKSEEYSAVKKRYDEYKAEELIDFTTFHQSFGYEEFIEGIRPVMGTENTTDIRYEIVDGVFKEFCTKTVSTKDLDIGLNKNPVVWKVSLARTYENEVRTECLENDHIRIAYDDYGETITDETDFSQLGGKGVLDSFINKMRVGDIVFSCYNANEIDAIGIVSGEYRWDNSYDRYKRVRDVKWIIKNVRENILEINDNKTMVLSAVYRLNISLKDVFDIIEKYKGDFIKSSAKVQNKVFVIDEINRGNIAKIFGELITLIEPTKRIGSEEELRAKLPYSKKLFGIPDNIYILGTMNTADRSIATVDTALRRRFSFEEMMPDANYLEGVFVQNISIRKLFETLNARIEALYDREHTVGHAYFKEVKEKPTIHTLGKVFSKKIIPLLQEYFYEDYEKIRLVLGDNQKKHGEPLFIETEQISKMNLFGNYDFDDDKEIYRVNEESCFDADAYIMMC